MRGVLKFEVQGYEESRLHLCPALCPAMGADYEDVPCFYCKAVIRNDLGKKVDDKLEYTVDDTTYDHSVYAIHRHKECPMEYEF